MKLFEIFLDKILVSCDLSNISIITSHIIILTEMINLHQSISITNFFLPPVETDLGSDDDVVDDTFIIFVKLCRFPVSLSNKNTQLPCQFILLEFYVTLMQFCLCSFTFNFGLLCSRKRFVKRSYVWSSIDLDFW